jgi:PAS domain S-box-containing protein
MGLAKPPSLNPTQSRLERFLGPFTSRLSQRIVLSVFTSIVAIETLILIPSVSRREWELLHHLSELSAATLIGAMGEAGMAPAEMKPKAVLGWIGRAEAIPAVAGGSLYTHQGELVGSFGEAPQLTYGQVNGLAGDHKVQRNRLYRQQRRYDAVWEMSPLDGQYLLIIRHNSTGVRRELLAFIGRIFGLVMIISVVVTLATMVVLRSILIKPVLALRNDLRQAAPAALQEAGAIAPQFTSRRYNRGDELGEVIMAFGEMFDRISGAIAQRQRAEGELRASETRFRTLVEQATESIFVLDQQARIIDSNRFAREELGYSREALLGFYFWDINPSFAPQDFEPLWQQLQSGEPVTLEGIHRRRDGSTFPVEVRIGRIESDGEQRLLGLARDITSRKQAEQAQARLAEIGELAAMIVHEVRNPLATVYMALTGFKQMALPPAGQLRLELAVEESERLQRLLNEILAYSREQKLAEEKIEMGMLVEELQQSLQVLPLADGRQIVVKTDGKQLTVTGDRDKLKQVFINLVTNACEAIPAGEQVTWKVESQPNHWIRIQIHNGGTPIPPEILPKLTQPFVSTKPGGNGLGLAITKRIVEAHGGSLAIASDAEQGTFVVVKLPALPQSPGAVSG